MRNLVLKIVSVLLLVCMAAAFAACGGGDKKPETTTDSGTTAAVAETTVPPETEATPAVFGDSADFDDYKCSVLLGLTTLGRNELVVEESSTVLNQALYNRQAIMADNHGVIFITEEHFTGGFSANTTLARDYSAGDCNYDFSIARILDAAKLTTNGHLYDMNHLENVDLSKPWWDADVSKDSTLAGGVYFASGDITTLVNDFVCCIAFNKDMYKQYSGKDSSEIYKAVDEGKWTLDYLNELSSLVSEDLNQDGVLDSRDKFGLTVWDSRVIATIHGAQGKVVSISDDGTLELTLNTERNATAVQHFIEICMHDYVLNMSGMQGGVDWKTIFANEQALFTMSSFNSLDYFRNLQTDYGILPQPKSFADQDDYFSSIVSTHASFVIVPAIQNDEGRTGAIIELLGYYGKKYVTPAYYDKTLNGTFIRDEESKAYIEICFAHKVVDLGDYFSIGTYYTQLAQLLDNKKVDGFASMYERYLKAANKSLDNLNEQIKLLAEKNKQN